MSIFTLPDLGEGLPDAEISEWHVKEGDSVNADQPLVAMETAKALVDVPSPRTGTIKKLYGQAGDVIDTGAPLVEFVSDQADPSNSKADKPDDTGTVAGVIERGEQILDESHVQIGGKSQRQRGKAMPKIRQAAKKLGINLQQINGDTVITSEQLNQHISQLTGGESTVEKFTGVRRAMSQAMSASHSEVVPVTIYDEADIHCWPQGTDISSRLLRAISQACCAEPGLNAWYDGDSMTRYVHQQVNIGIAMDANDELFVPVIKDVSQLSAEQLRQAINDLKTSVKNRTIKAEQLQGATISLTNFGMFAGRFATPIVVPPMVAIIGTGRLHESAVVVNRQVEAHRVLPISICFDHRALTGGEVTRFLAKMLEDLQSPS